MPDLSNPDSPSPVLPEDSDIEDLLRRKAEVFKDIAEDFRRQTEQNTRIARVP